MVKFITLNGTRQELHNTVSSARCSAARWVALGFSADIQWCDGFDNQLTVVIVRGE